MITSSPNDVTIHNTHNNYNVIKNTRTSEMAAEMNQHQPDTKSTAFSIFGIFSNVNIGIYSILKGYLKIINVCVYFNKLLFNKNTYISK